MNLGINEELVRLKTLMELRNNQVKVRMRQGVPYQDTTLPPNAEPTVFTGDEIGVVIGRNGSDQDGITQIQLDDGRVVLTGDEAVEDSNVTQDINSFEANDTNDSGMGWGY
jgi:hypothetical protein